MPSDAIPLAIIGEANPHVKFYYPGVFSRRGPFRLEAFSDTDAERRARFAALGRDTPIYSDHRELLDRHPGVRAVLVGVENGLRHSVLLDCLARGLHVFSTKILHFDETLAREIIDRARAAGRVLQVEMQMRLDPVMIELKRRLANGEIGKLRHLTLTNRSLCPTPYYPWTGDPALAYDGTPTPLAPGDPRFRGGALADHPHTMDLVHWLTGRRFVEVRGWASRNTREWLPVEDGVYALGRLDDGTTVSLDPSYSATEERTSVRRQIWPRSVDVMVRAVGERGILSGEAFGENYFVAGPRLHSPDRYLALSGMTHGVFPLQLARFASAIRGDAPPPANGEDGLAAIRVMNAIYRSISSGSAETLN